MKVEKYEAIDVIATEEDDHVLVEIQHRGETGAVLYVHINGITVCRVLANEIRLDIPHNSAHD